MKGGHSGVEIDKKRGNAIVAFLQFLSEYDDFFEVYDIFSGVASNVIPSKVKAVLGIENVIKFESELQKFLQSIKTEFDCPDISYLITQNSEESLAIKEGKQILENLSKIQDGVYSMSEKIP
ncbi:MAG TPA: peptidase dimerization domain-containing protein [Ignavibacteriaceae bacterium]